MNRDELKSVLEKHHKWLNNEEDGIRANLTRANLTFANLTEANLTRADLTRANLTGADLTRADLTRAKLPNFSICPEIGAFIAFKKGKHSCIIKLQIPASAKRTSSLVGRKCRASKAKVLSITDSNGKPIQSCKCWNENYDFVYEVGKTVIPDEYDDDIRIECSSGIHFFITEKEAREF